MTRKLKTLEDYERSREKLREYTAKYLNSDEQINKKLVNLYGITLKQYNILLYKQDNKCAICRKENTAINPRTKQVRRLGVDRRGDSVFLLCPTCKGIANLVKDNLDVIDLVVRHVSSEKEPTQLSFDI